MMFLLRITFWLSLVILLLPFGTDSGGGTTKASGLNAMQAFSAAGAAVSDLSQFCSRQPEACVAGTQAATVLGEKAQAAAGLMFDFLSKRNTGETAGASNMTSPIAEKSAASDSTAQNTLTPTDRAPAWRGPPSRTKQPA